MTTTILFNPALSWLLRAQARAKLGRLFRRFRSPRRFVLSGIALALAVVWLGNAAISILLRNPYPIETLQKWVPLTLMAYAFWHVLKVAWKRPEEPIEWGPAEGALVCGGPFSRQHVLAYRLTAVMSATVLKALLASVLFFPDLPVWPAGFLGIVLALAFLELLRMALEIATHGARPRAYLVFRIGVFGTAGAMAASAILTAMGEAAPVSTPQLLGRFVLAVTEFRHTWLGRLWEAPFATFSHVITESAVFRVEFVGWLSLALLQVASLARLVFWIDRVGYATVIRAERDGYQSSESTKDLQCDSPCRRSTKLPYVPRWGGAGPFVWRQMIGAFGHRVGLLMALIPPAALALLPLAVPLSPPATLLQVAGGLVFYSFLLLPAALKFDFRRDYDRLYAFKMLPASPSALVLGQLATPVFLTSAFQLIVLAVTVLVRPVEARYLVAAVALLLPLNVLIFAAENLIFLLSPYRLSQEGIDVFLRTILVFTAKGVFFAIGLAALLAWSFGASVVSHTLTDALGVTFPHGLLFLIGVEIVIGLTTLMILKLLIQAYQRYDPSLDAAG